MEAVPLLDVFANWLFSEETPASILSQFELIFSTSNRSDVVGFSRLRNEV